ncbi:MAG: VWA domain-containing protein [Gammaproteobacteria bacterium]|nr:VWA domain-containing protein [Gammaproteobacteria bacterium]
MSELHLLRPLWLGAIPLLVLLWWWGLRQRPLSLWQRLIPPDMLRHLLVGEQRAVHGWHGLLCGWLLAAIALAGPSWRQAEVPVTRNRQAAVIVLDLSPSMRAADLEPDRVTRARYKIIDLLRLRGDGLTALVVYGGDAHTVVPLTDDVRTIEALLPALGPETMPVQGANTEAAVALAAQLLDSLGQQDGQIVLVTDGIAPAVRPALRKQLPDRYRLSVLAVGTAAGAPIPESGGGFTTDAGGAVVLAAVDHDELRQLATEHRGRYASLATDDRDVRTIAAALDVAHSGAGQPDDRRHIDAPIDGGYWLLVLLVPLAALGFRRGLLFALLLTCVLPPHARAETAAERTTFRWTDLWLRPDQQGARALAADDPATAAQQFESPAWAGYAAYRNRDYPAAAEHLAAADDAVSHFNLGNALAQQGKLEEAVAAYQAAIDQAPRDEQLIADARHNKELVERRLRERAPQQSQGEGRQNSGEGADASPSDASGQSGSESQGTAADESRGDSPGGSSGGAAEQAADAAGAANDPARDSGDLADPAAGGPQAEQQAAAAASEQAAAGASEDDAAATAAAGSERDAPLTESSEQWLRAIPDDPAGLLRRKFSYESELARRNRQDRLQQEQRY